MKSEEIIANASPLIILYKSNLSDLFPRLFGQVLIPAAVWDEVLAGPETDRAALQLVSAGWAIRTNVGSIDPAVAAWNLGAGESEVIG